jgi:hypothetical protein
MTVKRLSFTTIEILSSDLVEIIIDYGIEVDLEMLTEYHNWISTNLSDPCMILINAMNSHTYSFDVQLAFGSFKQVKAVAALGYSDNAIAVAKFILTIPRPNPLNVKTFRDRDEALSWLEMQRALLT